MDGCNLDPMFVLPAHFHEFGPLSIVCFGQLHNSTNPASILHSYDAGQTTIEAIYQTIWKKGH